MTSKPNQKMTVNVFFLPVKQMLKPYSKIIFKSKDTCRSRIKVQQPNGNMKEVFILMNKLEFILFYLIIVMGFLGFNEK